MSTQEQIAGKGHSNTPKKFKYVLSSIDYGEKVLKFVPSGWDNSEITFLRDSVYKGVLTQFSTNELTFVKDGRDYIQTAYEAKGIDYEIEIKIYIEDSQTFAYSEYYRGKIDLSTYKIDSIGVECKVINTGFQSRILNRDKIEVDLLNTKFIGGGENSMEQISGMPTNLKLTEYSAIKNADWQSEGTLDNIQSGFSFFSIPMVLNSSEYEASETSNQTIVPVSPSSTTQKFFTPLSDITVNFSVNVTIVLISEGANNLDLQLKLYRNNTEVLTINPTSTTVQGEATQFDFSFNNSAYNFSELQSMTLLGYGYNTTKYSVEMYNGSVSFFETIGDSLEQVNIDSFPIFEFTARTLQLISGEASPLDSELLGRTDSLPVSYASDGLGSLMCMTNGLLIRQFDLSQITLNSSLTKVFKTINSLMNVGLGFENNKVKIEQEKYFFDITDNPNYPATDSRKYQTNQILDLSEYLNNEVIEKEVLPDWYYNEIESGYNSFEYENVQGLKEFNTKSAYATPIKSVEAKYDIVSPFRYDTQGVNKLRTKPQSTDGTEDVKGDNDIFGFDVKRDGGFTVKTDEDFDSVTGGVDPAQSYNLKYTPRRNLERHGNRFSSMRLALTDEIQWMQSDKNTKLVTQLTDEASPKAENADILVNELDSGYWIAEAYLFEAPVSKSTIDSIKLNPYGVIKVADDKYGWILEIQSNNENNKGQFKLLRVDLNNVKVNL
jgi:hypothetical protein